MRRERLYLEDILAAANSIAEFIGKQEYSSFEGNGVLRSAVAHHLMTIGEAVARLSKTTQERYPQIPWQDIKGLRNIIVHHYFGIDWDDVWRTAIEDVPVLRTQIIEVLHSEFPE